MIKIKKRSGPISRILYRPRAVPAIYLLPSLPTTSNDLPPGSGEQPEYTGIFGLSTRRCTTIDITADIGRLLPCLLTLTLAGGCFLLHLPQPRGCLPVKKGGALCCPDFPLARMCQRQTGLLRAGNGGRTRNLRLGKPPLCQLRYSRIYWLQNYTTFVFRKIYLHNFSYSRFIISVIS